MLRIILVLALAVQISGLLALPAAAEPTTGRMYLGPTIGYNFPVGELSSFAKGGPSIGGVFEYMSSSTLAWGLVGMYHTFDVKSSAMEDAFGTSSVDASYDIFELGLQARAFWRYSGSTTRNLPYGRVSFGIHHKTGEAKSSQTTPATDESIDETSTAIVLGAGMQLAVGQKHGVELDISWHHVFDSSVAYGFEVGHTNFWLFSASFLFGMGPDAPTSN